MISRRHLFTRLSALALAPLAKWLPKEELRYECLEAEFETPGTVYFSRIQDPSTWDYDQVKVFVDSYAVPQEEA